MTRTARPSPHDHAPPPEALADDAPLPADWTPSETDADGALWVFGYGSLLWNAPFAHAATHPGTLEGFRRAFCLRSVRYRGTPEAPGLVLALDPAAGAACRGLVFRVDAADVRPARRYLRHREMGTTSYHETFQTVRVDGRGPVRALAYVMDQAHDHYAPMTLERQAEIIAASAGPAGPNADYLHRTVERLTALDLLDDDLARLDALVRARQADRPAGEGPARGEGDAP